MTQISASVTVERGPFEMVPHWILDHPHISAQALRLYLLLRRHGDKDGRSFPGRKRLARQLHASASTVDRAKTELLEAGAMCQRHRTKDTGDWTSNEYHVHWDQRLDCPRLRGVRPGEGYPVYDDTPPVYDETPIPPMANELIPIENSDPLTHTRAAAAPASAETENQRANRLTRTYTDQVPLSNFPAVAGVIRKAIRTGRYDDQQITDALERMAEDNRSVTTDSLRIELEGVTYRNHKKSGTQMYVEIVQDLERQRNTNHRALTALGDAYGT